MIFRAQKLFNEIKGNNIFKTCFYVKYLLQNFKNKFF